MNKVITINLGGNAYQLEEGGYDALRAYLETAAARLQGNPDRDEILSDIERAIAEKFRALLASHKTVVVTKEVAAVLAEMGPIEADPGEAAAPGASGASGHGAVGEERAARGGGTPRRLYRIHEGAMISRRLQRDCRLREHRSDPRAARLCCFDSALGLRLARLCGDGISGPRGAFAGRKGGGLRRPIDGAKFIRRAKEGYYEAMKGFPDRKARREWKRRFKRDMRANADQWRHNWHCYWEEQAPIHPGMGFALPLLSLLHGVAKVLWICALISLLATGAVFGLALPANVPVWVAALLLFIAYGILVGPLKVARRACYRSLGRPRWAWSFVFLLDAVVWLAVVAALLWLAVHYFPELREAVRSFPSLAHQAADDIRTWWKGK